MDDIVLVAGVIALAVRRRFPLAVFIATLPMPLLMGQSAASLIALFTVACATRNRWLLSGCALVYAGLTITPWWGGGDILAESAWPVWGVYSLAPAGAAVFLGQLLQTKQELSRRLEEISERELQAKLSPIRADVVPIETLREGGTRRDLALPLLGLLLATLLL